MTKFITSLLPLRPQSPDRLTVVFFGGCGEFGMNVTGYLTAEGLILVDCGLMFSEPHQLGTDGVIPNLDRWIEELGGVRAYMMTHGHEDHIGALPYFIKRWPAPVYGTPWTMALLHDKLTQGGAPAPSSWEVVKAGMTVAIGAVKVTWVHVNHSIPMTTSLLIQSGTHKVFHTGDFKLETDSPYEPPLDLGFLDTLGSQGIHMLIADSTNAVSPGFSPGERSVIPDLEQCLKAPGRIFFATFSSNLWRILSVLNLCRKLGRKVCVSGAGLRKTLRIATELKLVSNLDEVVIHEEDLKQTERDDLLVLVSGCQGEFRSTLARLSLDEHSFFRLTSRDLVMFSSRVIPGNEKAVIAVMNRCVEKGVRVAWTKTHPGIHVSGHAYQSELVELLTRLKPRYHVPVHGTFTHLYSNADLAASLAATTPIKVENGTVLQLSDGVVTEAGVLEVEREFIDSWSRLPMSPERLRERLKIGDSGMAILSGAFSKQTKKWLAGPDMQFIGLPFPRELDVDAWKKQILDAVAPKFSGILQQVGQEAALEDLRIFVRRELGRMFIKKPVVLTPVSIF